MAYLRELSFYRRLLFAALVRYVGVVEVFWVGV